MQLFNFFQFNGYTFSFIKLHSFPYFFDFLTSFVDTFFIFPQVSSFVFKMNSFIFVIIFLV